MLEHALRSYLTHYTRAKASRTGLFKLLNQYPLPSYAAKSEEFGKAAKMVE